MKKKEVILCPDCGLPVSEKDNVCPNCGYDFIVNKK
jgi:DNA-directed RNA polymerase subunit RPC12/RpoP